ncbi:hypothetical protein C8Q75DRAFT_811537 [Abortiporus biennis]|nr:hypothetical protein C8Q75DRAFT_811537 [Abortiporus biennis]
MVSTRSSIQRTANATPSRAAQAAKTTTLGLTIVLPAMKARSVNAKDDLKEDKEDKATVTGGNSDIPKRRKRVLRIARKDGPSSSKKAASTHRTTLDSPFGNRTDDETDIELQKANTIPVVAPQPPVQRLMIPPIQDPAVAAILEGFTPLEVQTVNILVALRARRYPQGQLVA